MGGLGGRVVGKAIWQPPTNFSGVSSPRRAPFICGLITRDTWKRSHAHSSLHGTVITLTSTHPRQTLGNPGMKGIADKGDNWDAYYASGVPRCSRCVHTCGDNDTGKGREAGHCRVRPNKCAGAELQKSQNALGSFMRKFIRVVPGIFKSDGWFFIGNLKYILG